MLDALAKHDAFFRSVARKIDPEYGEDLVGDMYIKLSRRQIDFPTEGHLKAYAVLTIRSLKIDKERESKKVKTVELKDEHAIEPFDKFEVDDKGAKAIKALSFVERELLILNQSMSLRKIAKEYNLNYMFIHRTITNAKGRIATIAP